MATQHTQKRICLIGTDWNVNEYRKKNNQYGGVSYYRLIKPLLHLKGYDVTYWGANLGKEAEGKSPLEFWPNFVQKYDVFIVKAIDNEQALYPFIFCCQKYNKKLILDLDDNFFEVKEDQPAYEYYKIGKPKRAMMAALLSFVDGLFVSTQPLADYFKKYLKDVYNKDTPIFVLPNYHDKEDFNFPKPEKNKDKISIGWTGSTTHFNDLKIILPAMERLLREYPNLYLDLVGGLSYEDAPKLLQDFDQNLLERVFCGGGTLAWDGYPAFLMKQKWDIGLAPLTDDEFNHGKSHIKWMEYASIGIPCVASKVYPYYMPLLDQKTIVDGKTGFICEDSQWYETLKKLIDDKELRERVGFQAQQYVFKELQYKDHQQLWLDAVSQLVD